MESAQRRTTFPPVVPAFGRHGSAAAARKKLAELRGVLAERFPERRARDEVLATGFPPLDDGVDGGLPRGAVSEVVASRPSCGGQWVVHALLETARRTHQYLGLVDGSDGFDPQSEAEELLPYLLWIRCREAKAALQATDLLVRDGNISLVLLDLRGNLSGELRKQPVSVWYRLQRAVEKTGGILVVLGARPMVSSATTRREL